MDLVLDDKLKVGLITIHRRTEPAVGPWRPTIDELRQTVELIDGCGYDLLWCGDHISFPAAILDPLLQLAQAAVVSRRLVFGTSVYLLPLRHPVPVAKQVASLDHLSEGRFIFGVGVGGEFPQGVRVLRRADRRARRSASREAIPLLRKLWSGEPVSHQGRCYAAFEDVPMQPPARQPGGPPIWCGGRSDGALARAGRLADGWIAYVVTPEMYKEGLGKIAAAAKEAGRGGARGSAPGICCSRASTTPTRRPSMPPRSRSASATPWISAAPPSATRRWARRSRSPTASAPSIQPACATSRWTSSAPTRSATGRSRRVARDVLPLLADLR